jgi:hypothetical protein
MTQKEIWDRITSPKQTDIKNVGLVMVAAVKQPRK